MNFVPIIMGGAIFVSVIFVVLWLLTFTKGKITLILDKKSFSPGDKIIGKIVLTIKKPFEKAGPLKVSLICEETSQKKMADGRTTTSTKKLLEETEILDKERAYQVSEKAYDFEIKIPSMVTSHQMMKDTFMGFLEKKELKWKIFSSLEISGFNISNSVKISVF